MIACNSEEAVNVRTRCRKFYGNDLEPRVPERSLFNAIEAASSKWLVIASWITFAQTRILQEGGGTRSVKKRRGEARLRRGMTLHMRGLEWAWNKPGADARRVVVPIVAVPRARNVHPGRLPFSKSEGPTHRMQRGIYKYPWRFCLRSFCVNETDERTTRRGKTLRDAYGRGECVSPARKVQSQSKAADELFLRAQKERKRERWKEGGHSEKN